MENRRDSATGAAESTEDGRTGKREWQLTPRLSLTETYTDNVLLKNTDRHSDWVTDLSPGLRISGESKRLQAYFDYSLRELIYANNSRGHQTQNSLNTFGKLEAVDRLLFVDFSGTIAQQTISAFGVPSPSAAYINSNLTETSTLRVSPYLKGRLGSIADYELRYAATQLHTDSSRISDTNLQAWNARLGGTTTLAWLAWSVDGDWQTANYSAGRQSESSQISGRLTWQVDDTLRLSAIAGREENNFRTLNKESKDNYGLGLDWTPTPRTKLSAEGVKRFFGTGHHISFEHRTPRTITQIMSSRDVTANTTGSNAGGSVGNIYDMLFNQMASFEPDPVKRATLVTAFLEANNIAPNAVVTSGFINSGPTLQRLNNASFALLGARNTLTFIFSQGDTQRLGLLAAAGEDLATARAVRQRGFNVTLVHDLTPLTHLNLLGTQQHNTSTGLSLETTTRILTATISSKLGAHTSASLGARRSLFQSPTAPYSETAIIGTLNLQY